MKMFFISVLISFPTMGFANGNSEAFVYKSPTQRAFPSYHRFYSDKLKSYQQMNRNQEAKLRHHFQKKYQTFQNQAMGSTYPQTTYRKNHQ